jgi:hypothetical protein
MPLATTVCPPCELILGLKSRGPWPDECSAYIHHLSHSRPPDSAGQLMALPTLAQTKSIPPACSSQDRHRSPHSAAECRCCWLVPARRWQCPTWKLDGDGDGGQGLAWRLRRLVVPVAYPEVYSTLKRISFQLIRGM